MKELLESLLQKLTGSTEITIETEEDDYSSRFIISIPQEHIPIVIGRSGRTINALRTLMSVYDALHGGSRKKIFLTIAQ